MAEELKKESISGTSSKISDDILAKKARLLEIEKEQDSLNKDLSESLEKIADIKSKMADKVECLSEESFIKFVAKNKIYSDLLGKAEKLKSSGDSSSEKLQQIERDVSEAKEDMCKAKEDSSEMKKKADMFRKEAEKALEKFKRNLRKSLKKV